MPPPPNSPSVSTSWVTSDVPGLLRSPGKELREERQKEGWGERGTPPAPTPHGFHKAGERLLPARLGQPDYPLTLRRIRSNERVTRAPTGGGHSPPPHLARAVRMRLHSAGREEG